MDDAASSWNIVSHLGEAEYRYAGAVVPPLFQNSLFTGSSRRSERELGGGLGPYFSYTRGGNPTIAVAESKLAALEGTERALCFSSGMAAITSTLLSCLKSGDHVVAMKSVYGGTRQFLENWLPRFGVETSFVTGDDPEEFFQAADERTRIFYLESPSTFLFKVIDLASITAGARERGITTILDNSWATPIFQRPAESGVDLIVHSASKYLGGHSDIVAGVVAGAAAHLQQMVMEERMLLGGSMDPHQAWLLTRGLRTLPLRMQRHQESGLAVARALAEHPRVLEVFHPGLPGGRYHEQARRQLDGYSALFSIVVDAPDGAIQAALDHLEVFRYGPSWGGFESLVVAPFLEADTVAVRENLGIPAGLVRLSVGLEDPQWLLEDLRRFLDSLEA